jgi:uncharacterized membrane protein
MQRVAIVLALLHVAALGLGLAGILIVMPHPELLNSAASIAFYAWATGNAGSLGMITGAAAALAWGGWAIGWRRTLIFFVVSCVVSATAELTGTKTGWPFGGYEYLSLLGWKMAGRVPVGIPLSWFYMGLVSYALAHAIVLPRADRRSTLFAIALGTWFLVAWDLVLDPAMAALPRIQFWAWHEHGSYFGMPLRNLVGWYGTGFAFIGLSRWLWGSDIGSLEGRLAVPLFIYVVNVVWAMILALSAGLWQTAFALVIVAVFPALFAVSRRVAPR